MAGEEEVLFELHCVTGLLPGLATSTKDDKTSSPSVDGAQPDDGEAASQPKNSNSRASTPDSSNNALKRPREDSPDEAKNTRPEKIPSHFPFSNIPSMSDSDDDNHDELQNFIVDPDLIEASFEDVHVHPSIIEALDNITLPMKCPEAFRHGILSKCPPPSVLLYGPPGTGKTLLVRALAKQAECKVLAISGADINDKYVGIGEKRIKRLFEVARQKYPCIIFIDEADTMFRSRSAGGRSCDSAYLNEFLVAMDGINSTSTKNPIVVAATNRPYDIDDGIMRRLGRRIMVDLPDATAREDILKILLRGETLADDVDLSELARATPDYSGSDLRYLVQSAAIKALQEQLSRSRKFTATEASDTPYSAGSGVQRHRILRREHFLYAKRATPRTPMSDTVSKIREFHNKYGDTLQKSSGNGPVNKASFVSH